MNHRQLLVILHEWSKEQPDRCQYLADDPLFESTWQVFLQHPKYGGNPAGGSWIDVVDEAGSLYAAESFLVISTAIQVAKPSCLSEFLKLVKPMTEKVTILVGADRE